MMIRRRKMILSGIGIFLLFLSFPIAFIARTAISEDGHKPPIPTG